MAAAGDFRLARFSGIRIPGGLTESTTTHDSLTPRYTETAGTVKPRKLFLSSFLEAFSGAPWKQSKKAMACSIWTEVYLLAHKLIADWCVRLTWTNGVRVTPWGWLPRSSVFVGRFPSDLCGLCLP